MKIIIQNNTNYEIPQKSIQELFKKTLAVLKKQKSQGIIELTFVTPQNIKRFNKKYRDKNVITDVLSFAYESEKFIKQDVMGEIIICPKQAEVQKSASKSLKSELNKLFVHGMLHIFGFDHETDEEFYTMNKYEKKILRSH